MNIQITSDNIQMTDSMKSLVEQKLPKLLKRIKENTPEDLVDLRVVLNKGDAEDTFEVKFDLSMGNMRVVGKDYEYTLESAVVKAIEDTIRQFEKEKSKKDGIDWDKRRELKTYQGE